MVRRRLKLHGVIIGVAAFLLIGCGFFNSLQAALYIEESDAIFNVIDGDDDNKVSLQVMSNFFTPDLEIKYSGHDWTNLYSTFLPFAGLDISTGDDSIESIMFRLHLSGDIYAYKADMIFSNLNPSSNDTIWNALTLNFLDAAIAPFNLTITSAIGATDHIAPVPVPAAVWLFGSGLMGLIILRRRPIMKA